MAGEVRVAMEMATEATMGGVAAVAKVKRK